MWIDLVEEIDFKLSEAWLIWVFKSILEVTQIFNMIPFNDTDIFFWRLKKISPVSKCIYEYILVLNWLKLIIYIKNEIDKQILFHYYTINIIPIGCI